MVQSDFIHDLSDEGRLPEGEAPRYTEDRAPFDPRVFPWLRAQTPLPQSHEVSTPLLQRIPNKFWRFYAVGLFTTGVCWALYELLYAAQLSDAFQASAAWAISYSLTSVLAHALHFRFTFESKRSYWPSLWRTLMVYGCSMILSTVADHFLAQQMHHRLAWILNMGCFGLLNFFVLRYYAYYEDLPQRS